MVYFADTMCRTMDSLGIETCDLWGSMTGAHCGIEVALMRPDRIRVLYIEALFEYDEATEKAMHDGHAPKAVIDQIGSQFNFFWHLARDQHLFFPWFTRDAAHARNQGLPTARQLHDKTVELLKVADTYHVALNAAVRHKSGERLKDVTVPVIGPEWLQKYLPSVKVRGDFVIGAEASPPEKVEASAKEILRHLG
jgi:pimeloyl-ACP methyl ester carboxylesterase